MTLAAVPRTLAALGLVVTCLGLPLNTFADFATLLVVLLALVAGTVRRDVFFWAAAPVTVALVVIMANALPRPDIEEGHNVFVYDGPGGVFERALPPEVFQSLRDGFQTRYPKGVQAKAADRPFAFSADAVFQTPKYSRVVHRIAFTSATDLRLGAINSWTYNVYWPEHGLERDALPYFVLYELPPTLADGALCWRGDVFWPTPDGHFTRERHEDMACRTLSGETTRVYGVDIDPAHPLAMALHPPDLMAAASVFAPALRVMGALLVTFMLVRVNRHALALPLLSVMATLAVIPLAVAGLRSGFAFNPFSGFVIYQGGNDGLTYASFAHDILAAASRGDWWAALRGGSDVFFFMPGQCYVFVTQLILFGDTAFGFLLWGLFLPLIVLALARRLLPEGWAVWLLIAFLVVPVFEAFGWWNFYFVRDLFKGFGEPFSYGLFMLGLIVALPRLGRAPTGEGWAWAAAGLALAAAVAIRPNLSPGAAVLLLASAFHLLRHGRVGSLAALSAGFAPILLCPLHNWAFGHVFAPFVGATTIGYDLEASPADYLRALGDLVTFDWHTEVMARVGHKLRHWVAPYEVWRQVALVVAVWVAARRSSPLPLRALALIVLVQQVMLLIFLSGGRYGHLTWMLTLLLAAVVVHDDGLPWLTRRFPAPGHRS